MRNIIHKTLFIFSVFEMLHIASLTPEKVFLILHRKMFYKFSIMCLNLNFLFKFSTYYYCFADISEFVFELGYE